MSSFRKPDSMTDELVPYCPGCGHGVALRLVGEAIDELEAVDRTIGIAPVGCAIRSWTLFEFDMTQAAHGRGPAVATGLKNARPDNLVFSYQGDGDTTSIGTAEIVHAALRGENITVIMVNNAIYGATGGQMAPTTLVGQPSSSYPSGRDPDRVGTPIHMAELIAMVSDSAYSVRRAVDTPADIRAAGRAIETAFRIQERELGFSFVEILSPCPVGWNMEPLEAREWLSEAVVEEFPLEDFSVPEGFEE